MQWRYLKTVHAKRFLLQWLVLLSVPFLWGACVKTNTDTHSQPPSHIDARFDQTVQDIQRELVRKGYKPGPVDGIFGKKTRLALKVFQKNNALAITGRLDAVTQKLLLSGDGIAPSSAVPQLPEAKQALVSTPVSDLKPEPEPKSESISLQPNEPVAKLGTVNEETAIMTTASTFSDTVIDVSPGTMVEVLGKKKDFLEVQYKGKKGYIYSYYVDIKE
jgi:Putative peptidoglycan binding domain/Bacterial SH3 domain